ncbi:MAG TPA: metallophosphoesterase [Chthoniobacterales bacterium]|nr:metallophosphoesterase [Chthoniobacterales bacterium]
MRLLLTAELHYRLFWFKWLEAQAVHYDALAICGDLLDVFYKEPLKRQVQRTTSWLRALADKTSVILCSGNHDTIDFPVERSSGAIPLWLNELDSIITVDGNTTVIRDQIVITSLSFVATATQKRPVLAAGAQLRAEKGLPWLVLHHHPPAFHPGIGPEELTAGRLLKEFSPDFWAAGRLYGHQPFLKKRGWLQRMDNSIVLNTPQLYVGQELLEGPFPNHIVLDLTARKLTWHCAFQEKVDQETFQLQ